MWKQMMPGLRMTIVLTVLTGVVYPGLVTALSQMMFPSQANGSLVHRNGKVIGSALIGQSFTKPEYFHPRPSAAGSDGYDASASGGSNLGPSSRKLIERVKASAGKWRSQEGISEALPSDLLTASGSGLDPHLSPGSAQLQARRVASVRGVAAAEILSLVEGMTEGRDLGVLGEPRVNVLMLNLKLDEKFPLRKGN